MEEFWNTENLDALEDLNNGETKNLVKLLAGINFLHSEVRLLLADTLDRSADTRCYYEVKLRHKGRPNLKKTINEFDTKDPIPLIQHLRNDNAIPVDARTTLTEMLNSSGRSEWYFKPGYRRPGKPSDTLTRDMHLGLLVAKYFKSEGQGTFEAAVTQVCEETSMSRSTVTEAYKIHNSIAGIYSEDQ